MNSTLCFVARVQSDPSDFLAVTLGIRESRAITDRHQVPFQAGWFVAISNNSMSLHNGTDDGESILYSKISEMFEPHPSNLW